MYTLLLLLLPPSHFSRVQLCATPETAAHQASPSLGFSRQEHWSGLPFPSPMHESEVTQSCRLLVTPWTAAHQAPLSMGFSRQERVAIGSLLEKYKFLASILVILTKEPSSLFQTILLGKFGTFSNLRTFGSDLSSHSLVLGRGLMFRNLIASLRKNGARIWVATEKCLPSLTFSIKRIGQGRERMKI